MCQRHSTFKPWYGSSLLTAYDYILMIITKVSICLCGIWHSRLFSQYGMGREECLVKSRGFLVLKDYMKTWGGG
jgi:hypothetical protein